jgi:hypothetical protein
MTGVRSARAGLEATLELLLPRPRRVVPSGGSLVLPRVLRCESPHAHALEPDFCRFGARVGEFDLAVELTSGTSDAHVRLAIDGGGIAPSGYRLRVSARGIDIDAGDAAGAWYALCTLAQMIRVAARERGAVREIPCVLIEDAPDFESRGLLIDVSRGKVPTLATLHEIVELCARLKLNELQLYTEHAFAYAGHERVWRDASPITPADVRDLDRACRERHIELVPNQQSFGHMHRWLKHAPYRELAEVPEGIVHAFSREREPYGLCPIDPRSLALLEDLYDQMLPCFSSRMFDVGLDETIDLGLGRSKEACTERGKARAYLDFLNAVHERVAARGRRMQFWGDVIVERPELVRELPRDAIALEWGYEAAHPFAEHAHLFAESGLDFYVCPGTSSWQSIAGRTQNALANLESAAVHGKAHGARGYLVTDWGDRGHLQPLSASHLGIAAAAAFAWNSSSAGDREIDWPALLDAHVFDGGASGLGRAACELGDAYAQTGSASTNGSPLFFVLAFADEPLPHPRLPDLSIAGLTRALEYTREKRSALAASSVSASGSLARDELAWAADLLAFAARLGIARLKIESGSPITALGARDKLVLSNELEPLVAEHRRLWLARNRIGGLDESAGWLTRIASLLGS